MSKNYKHLFFDLDHTLWDFERSARETFRFLFKKHGLEALGVPSLDAFVAEYTKHNTRLWEYYRNGTLKKEILRSLRFQQTLEGFYIDDEALAAAIGDDYVYFSPRTVFLMPGALTTVEQLATKYSLHIITNGFEEVQHIKLQESKLRPFFTTVTTSEEAGTKKPDAGIFAYALKKAGATASESVMIGDHPEVDIAGAHEAGLATIFFNPHPSQNGSPADHEIRKLESLLEIF